MIIVIIIIVILLIIGLIMNMWEFIEEKVFPFLGAIILLALIYYGWDYICEKYGMEKIVLIAKYIALIVGVIIAICIVVSVVVSIIEKIITKIRVDTIDKVFIGEIIEIVNIGKPIKLSELNIILVKALYKKLNSQKKYENHRKCINMSFHDYIGKMINNFEIEGMIIIVRLKNPEVKNSNDYLIRSKNCNENDFKSIVVNVD